MTKIKTSFIILTLFFSIFIVAFSNAVTLDLMQNDDQSFSEGLGAENQFLPAAMTASLRWSYLTGGDVHSSPTVVDLDGDGAPEIPVGSHDNRLYCLNQTGGIEWYYQTEGDIYTSPAVVDLDNDGMLEVLVSPSEYFLHCINHTGGLEWKYNISADGRFYPSSPTVGDLD